MELERPCFFFCLCLFFFGESWSESDVPVVCGGFIKSSFPVDFSQVKVNIYSIDGMLKYSTDCAPNNGYFLFPLYDQGEYLVKAVPPHGWMIAPNEVPLVVKDTKISCNSGRDIFFQLIGFTLEGQVTSGDILPGPEGVEVSLLPSEGANEEAEIRHVYTVVEGRFKIEGVSPGVYHVSAHHPLWKMSQDSIQVVVVDTPVIAPAGLKVLGFDVKGAVESGGEPVNGVFLFLFATQQLEGSRKEVHVSYKTPKAYLLTPQRKRLGKAVARRSHKTVATECLKNERSRNHVVNIFCSLIHKEVKSIASTKVKSTLLYQSKQSICDFDWKKVEREMATHCPLLLRVLAAATKTRSERVNRTMTIVMCFAMIVKHRNPNVNLLQKIITLILYAGHCSKQVYQRLQPLNITMSYFSLLRLLDKIGENHDAKVKCWRDAIVERLKTQAQESGVNLLQLKASNCEKYALALLDMRNWLCAVTRIVKMARSGARNHHCQNPKQCCWKMVCSLNEASPPPSPKDTKAHVCAVMSDSSGHFIFYPLPPGTYSVVPVYRLKDLHFEVHPVEVHFTVSNDSVTLPHHFEVQGFTVTGQVVLTREGPPVVGARVMLGDHHGAITDENGRYQLLNVTTGSYILKVEGQDMQFDLKEVHISPTNPSLLPVSPNKYLVCGDVVETIPVATSRKGKSRKIQVLSTVTKSVVIATSNTQEDGNFCVYLPLGEYRVKVVVSSEEGEKGMMILPVEQFVAMQDTPIASRIIFTQFLASLSGSVICIENCPETLDIQLHRSQEGTQDLSARVQVNGTRAHFNFTDVLPGGVKVILNYVGWCWEMSELAIVVIKGSQTPLLFSHTGYSLNYEVSHDTLIKYSRGNNFSEEAVLMAKGSLCLKEPGVYRIVPQSCHEFEKDVYIFDTSSPIDLVLRSTGHSLHIPVRTQVEDSSLIVVITSSGSEKKLKPDKVEKLSEGEWMYSFSAIVRVSLEVIIQPRASVLMFSPASLVWTVGQGCPETVTTFLGSPGELIEGKVEPSLANVTVVVDLGSEGQVTTYTDVSGYYRAGPVRGGDHITVSVVHEGYIFEPLDDKYSFKAIKLCDVTVQVTIGDGEPLAGALVSISGEDFRQNSFTDDSGVLSYYELAPGQYFLKPFLREFDFTPSSLILNLSEGSNKAAVFVGRRVAFSCSGVVSTLNRRQFASVGIQASGIVEGEKCFSYSETTTTDSDGMYRLHGLIPGCQYNVSVKDLGNEPSNSLPSFRTLVIEESDVDGVDFLLVSQMKWIYISGWVDTDPKFVGTLKVGVSAEGKAEESPLYSVAVDAVGFFDFPPLSPLLIGNYILSLQSSLSTHSYKFASVEKVVAGADDSHVLLNFEAEEVHVDKESQSKGSVVALILVVALAFAVLNFDKVLMQIRSYTHSLTSSSNGSDKRKLSQRSIKK